VTLEYNGWCVEEGRHEMSTVTSTLHREPELVGQTVVVIGGSSGIGLETARRACAEGAKVDCRIAHYRRRWSWRPSTRRSPSDDTAYR
jgi:hypothetical protein